MGREVRSASRHVKKLADRRWMKKWPVINSPSKIPIRG